MNPIEIKNLLTNSGLIVTDIDRYFVYFQDPSCIFPAFDSVLNFAWIVIVCLTVIMLFGWGILYIKNGAKLDTISNNFKTLVLIFFTISTIKPIVSFVYGEDLFAKQCEIKRVSLSSVNELLEMRHKQLSGSDQYLLSESFFVIDSGAIFDSDYPGVVSLSDSISTQTNNNKSVNYDKQTTIFTTSDGQKIKHIGGSVAWRNNNPGNIKKSDFAYKNGAIGETDKWAVFPDEQTGLKAIVNLLKTGNYYNLSVSGAIHRWAPTSDNNDPQKYSERVEQLTGLNADTKINRLKDDDLLKIARAIQKIEGWTPGTIQKM